MTCGPGRCHLKPIIGVPPPHTHYDSECEAGGYERRRSSRHSSGANTHTPPHLPVRTRSLAPKRGPVASVGQAPTRGPWRIALRTPPSSHTHPPRRGAVRHGAADPPTLATATAGAGCGGGGMSETRRGINGHRGRDDPATTPPARRSRDSRPHRCGRSTAQADTRPAGRSTHERRWGRAVCYHVGRARKGGREGGCWTAAVPSGRGFGLPMGWHYACASVHRGGSDLYWLTMTRSGQSCRGTRRHG